MGGRKAVYELMGMVPPPPPPKKKLLQVPKLKIDRTGEDDQARYSGLKLGQIVDDDTMAIALAQTKFITIAFGRIKLSLYPMKPEQNAGNFKDEKIRFYF